MWHQNINLKKWKWTSEIESNQNSEQENNQQNEEGTSGMGENNCKPQI